MDGGLMVTVPVSGSGQPQTPSPTSCCSCSSPSLCHHQPASHIVVQTTGIPIKEDPETLILSPAPSLTSSTHLDTICVTGGVCPHSSPPYTNGSSTTITNLPQPPNCQQSLTTAHSYHPDAISPPIVDLNHNHHHHQPLLQSHAVVLAPAATGPSLSPPIVASFSSSSSSGCSVGSSITSGSDRTSSIGSHSGLQHHLSSVNQHHSNSHNINNNNNSNMVTSADYLAQLLKDQKQMSAFPGVFFHIERLLNEEINRVRSSLFQINGNEKKSLTLPEAEGPQIQKTDKIFVPIEKYPEYNFVGRILGPRGMTAKQLEQETGCKIMVRGKGSMRDRKKEDQNRGKPNWEHLNEALHVLITCEDTENRANVKLQMARDEVEKLLVPVADGEDDLKRRQLMELAIIKGTYRDSTAKQQQQSGVGGGAINSGGECESRSSLNALSGSSNQSFCYGSFFVAPRLMPNPNSSMSPFSGSTDHYTIEQDSLKMPMTPVIRHPGLGHPLIIPSHGQMIHHALGGPTMIAPPLEGGHHHAMYSRAYELQYPQLMPGLSLFDYQNAANLESAAGKHRRILSTNNVRDHPYQRSNGKQK